MKVRKFLLENEKGQQFDMNNYKKGCLLTNPTELGYSNKSEFYQIGNTFIETIRTVEQKNPSGIANFNSYDKYKEFIDFIEMSYKLKFVYIVPFELGYKTYYRDVSISAIQKTEKQAKMLSCPVSFYGLSLWYLATTAIYEMTAGENEMRWDFVWDSRFSNYSNRSLSYINEGHVEAPIEVTINGNVKNPKIELYVEGDLYQTVKFNITLSQYEKLSYGTRENNFYLLKEEADGTTTDIFNLDVVDFENDNVIRLPKGKSCEIRLVAENDISSAEVIIYSYFKAV